MTHTALVTGGNRGIGFEIVRGLAQKGYKVLLASRDKAAGEEAKEELVGDIHVVELDLAKRQTLGDQLTQIEAVMGDIHVLVNNAGILVQGDACDVSLADIHASMQVNLLGPWQLCRQLAPKMAERGYGRIVNLTSGYGAFAEGLEGPAAYSVSKAALNALTVKLAQSMPTGVKVNAMCPGWVHTRMGGSEAPRSPQQGAETAIWLASIDEDGPTGGFFRDRQPIQW